MPIFQQLLSSSLGFIEISCSNPPVVDWGYQLVETGGRKAFRIVFPRDGGLLTLRRKRGCILDDPILQQDEKGHFVGTHMREH